MEIKEYKNKNQVINRLKEIEKDYLKSERKTYRILKEAKKRGKHPLPITSIKDQVINCMYCDGEVEELNAWLLGYNCCKLKDRKK